MRDNVSRTAVRFCLNPYRPDDVDFLTFSSASLIGNSKLFWIWMA